MIRLYACCMFITYVLDIVFFIIFILYLQFHYFTTLVKILFLQGNILYLEEYAGEWKLSRDLAVFKQITPTGMLIDCVHHETVKSSGFLGANLDSEIFCD